MAIDEAALSICGMWGAGVVEGLSAIPAFPLWE